MNNCYVIKKWRAFELHKSAANFKSQKIFNAQLEVVAEEILFNAGSIPADDVLQNCELFFSHPSYIENLILATQYRAKEAHLSRIFINIEQQTLCDQWSIARFIELNQSLKQSDCELVVEVTERMNCGLCHRLEEGLKLLKQANITLALDDYNLHPDELPFKLAYFDIIKMLNPPSNEFADFEDYLISDKEISHKEFIIESIEKQSQLDQLLNCNLAANQLSFQGFLLHKPEPLAS